MRLNPALCIALGSMGSSMGSSIFPRIGRHRLTCDDENSTSSAISLTMESLKWYLHPIHELKADAVPIAAGQSCTDCCNPKLHRMFCKSITNSKPCLAHDMRPFENSAVSQANKDGKGTKRRKGPSTVLERFDIRIVVSAERRATAIRHMNVVCQT